MGKSKFVKFHTKEGNKLFVVAKDRIVCVVEGDDGTCSVTFVANKDRGETLSVKTAEDISYALDRLI